MFLSDIKQKSSFFFFFSKQYTRPCASTFLRFSKVTTPPQRVRDVIDFATGVFRLTETTKLNGRTFRPSLLRDHVSAAITPAGELSPTWNATVKKIRLVRAFTDYQDTGHSRSFAKKFPMVF